MEVLAERIVQLRKSLRISSETVARRLEVSHKTVVNWEKDRGDPSVKNLLMLADLFGVSADYLIGRTDDPGGLTSNGGARRGAATDPDVVVDELGAAEPARRVSHPKTPRPRGSSDRRRPES